MNISQIEKINQTVKAAQLLFSQPHFGVQSLSFNQFWLVGDTVRNLLLQANPTLHNYSFYLQIFSDEEVFAWVEAFKRNKVPHILTENKITNILFTQDIIATLHCNLLSFGVDTECEIFIGKSKPQTFIENFYPINVSQVGIDVFKTSMLGFQATDLAQSIWATPAFKEAQKTKKILITRPEIVDENQFYDEVITPYLLRTYENLKDAKFTM